MQDIVTYLTIYVQLAKEIPLNELEKEVEDAVFIFSPQSHVSLLSCKVVTKVGLFGVRS